jgi:hypothetical protein
VVEEFYTPERIAGEITAPEGWDGWLVAVDGDRVVGAAGGGYDRAGGSASASSG